jgi:CHAT domain-containing protein/tetratricopeptide (TPR) repeat protein
MLRGARSSLAALGVLIASACPASTQVQTSLAPRTAVDINSILEGERPNLGDIAAKQALAESPVPETLAGAELARFYHRRALARWDLGRPKQAIEDCESAIGVARASSLDPYDHQTLLLRLISNTGEPWRAVGVLDEMVRDNSAPYRRWRLLSIYRHRILNTLQAGRTDEAENYLKLAEAIMADAIARDIPLGLASNWVLEDARANVLVRRGDYAAAEHSMQRAREFNLIVIERQASQGNYNLRSSQEFNADHSIVIAARMKMLQGRLTEAESDMRRALLNRLKAVGKYNVEMPLFIQPLAAVIAVQGRFAEAEKLIRTAVEISDALGIAKDSTRHLEILQSLAKILALEDHWSDAAAAFDEMENITGRLPEQVRDLYLLSSVHVNALYETARVPEGIKLAQLLVRKQTIGLGPNHIETANAHGFLAIGLALTHREKEALQEFAAAISVFESQAAGDDEGNGALLLDKARRTIVEAYITLLARSSSPSQTTDINESFRLADLIRGSAVQRAIARSAARVAAGNDVLSGLVRREQDLEIQIREQLLTLNKLLATPSDQRGEGSIKAVDASIERLRRERDSARAEIGVKFPSYASLVDPKPPSIDEIRASLTPGEAMLSFYFGRQASFVWVVAKEGAATFAEIDVTRDRIDERVHKLREPFESQAAMISDIRPFDLSLAYDLYSLLLKPTRSTWERARSLIVATNGALGLLPLSLLPTAPATVQTDDDPLFSSYRAIPWLARTHTVTLVPSAAALQTLRRLPPANPLRRELIAFGDPLFSAEQAAELQAPARELVVADAGAIASRGLPLVRRSTPNLSGGGSIDLSMLPPLPDTADELRAIARALGADPATSVQLGRSANEQAVKTMDLSTFKVVVFATHGLVAGELDGLTEPALALSAPHLAGVEGDGLLKLSEILDLRLDADWVVLSACNTGAGQTTGSEAASGLGKAFFYAGTRAVLVTNWSVNSAASRQLIADLFRRQSENPALTRAEALRQASLALIDGPGFTDSRGATLFAYAHPLFWASYAIIGDGG